MPIWSRFHIINHTSGVKTFVNEFAAYDELGKLIDNKATFYNWTENYNRTWSYTGDLDITFYPDETFNTTDVLYYGYIQVGDSIILHWWIQVEASGARVPSSGYKLFHFHVVFGKNWLK